MGSPMGYMTKQGMEQELSNLGLKDIMLMMAAIFL